MTDGSDENWSGMRNVKRSQQDQHADGDIRGDGHVDEECRNGMSIITTATSNRRQ
ncbi:hypothetical protein ACFSQT_02715 [Mesorhizobium calcicola]|uniref:Uncharacterized protein n=1 Tax=Mesorhizobium calcicola TaxID=1300310 RepID=A0ABW4W7W9_9HYPH